MKLIINIPAYNEEQDIGKTIKNLPREVPGFDKTSIQLIDDGSTDNTIKEAKKAGVDFIYSNKINRGLGVAFRKAVIKTLENNYDVMVNIDADGQFNAQDIPALVGPILKNKSDMVIGSRFSGKDPKNMPFIRKFLNKTAAAIVGLFLGIKTDDITCGFRAYNKESMLKLNLSHQFTYTQETIIDAISKNLKIIWLPVEVIYFKNRKAKLTKNINNFIYQSLMIILKTIRDTKPLKFFGFPAFLMVFFACILFGVFFWNYFTTFKITPYRNWLELGSILIVLGIQFLIFAFLADMIKSSRRITEDEMYERRKTRFEKSRKNKKENE